MIHSTTSRRAAAVLLAASLAACRSASAPPPVAPAAPAPAAAASPAPHADATHWVRTAAEYRAIALQTYRLATRELEQRAAGRAPGSWAVVLDADETIIDNSLYQKERAGRPFTAESWAEWVERRAAPPIAGSLPFLARARELGGRIAIVTNRAADECAATEDNFRRFEIPYDLMLCRSAGGPSDKNPRYESVRNGTASASLPPVEILMWVGDNIQDFPGLRQDVQRTRPDADYGDFGSRFFVIPNPMYGSWERNPAN